MRWIYLNDDRRNVDHCKICEKQLPLEVDVWLSETMIRVSTIGFVEAYCGVCWGMDRRFEEERQLKLLQIEKLRKEGK